MDGVIVGGWGYVAAAWGISLGLLLGWTVLLNVRLRAARKGAAEELPGGTVNAG
jgi:hypothetical protein